MNKEQKKKLLRYLYPTEEIKSFMLNDLNQELISFIPVELCFNSTNIKPRNRKSNFIRVSGLIKLFLKDNRQYLHELQRLYSFKDKDDLFKVVITNYLFYLSNINEKLKNIDILRDEQSICYSDISVIDII